MILCFRKKPTFPLFYFLELFQFSFFLSNKTVKHGERNRLAEVWTLDGEQSEKRGNCQNLWLSEKTFTTTTITKTKSEKDQQPKTSSTLKVNRNSELDPKTNVTTIFASLSLFLSL